MCNIPSLLALHAFIFVIASFQLSIKVAKVTRSFNSDSFFRWLLIWWLLDVSYTNYSGQTNK